MAELHSLLICQTAPLVGDGVSREVDWSYPGLVPAYLKKVFISHGVDYNAAVDMSTGVYRGNDGMLIAWHRGDAHSPGAGPLEQMYDFSPDYITLLPGDGLRMINTCAALNPTTARGNFYIVVYWTTEP